MKTALKRGFFWSVLVVFSLGVFLYFASLSLFSFLTYVSFDQKTEARVFSWEIKNSKDNYYILAHYQYNWPASSGNMEEKEQTTVFSKTFLNYPAAFAFLKAEAKKNWSAWYSSKSPDKATLVKEFNLKNLVYAIISFAVFIYFFVLKYKLQKNEL